MVDDSVQFNRFPTLLHVSDMGRQASYEPEAFVNSVTTFKSKPMPLGLGSQPPPVDRDPSVSQEGPGFAYLIPDELCFLRFDVRIVTPKVLYVPL